MAAGGELVLTLPITPVDNTVPWSLPPGNRLQQNGFLIGDLSLRRNRPVDFDGGNASQSLGTGTR